MSNARGNKRVRSLRQRRKRSRTAFSFRLPSPGWFPLIGAAGGFALILILVSLAGRAVDAKVDETASLIQEEWLAPDISKQTARAPKILSTRLKAGDSSISALERLGFDSASAHRMVRQARPAYSLSRVQAGHHFERIDSLAGVDVYYHIDGLTRLHLHRATGHEDWQADLTTRQTSSRQHIASATIEDSLFAAAAKAGLDDRTTMNLVDIFAWAIDFARDIRKGDSFKVLYEERFDDRGVQLGSVIMAAEFTNQGNRYRAVRYEQADGRVHYFTPSGKSMRKAYLKAPVKFSRISSRFQLRRKHPVLGYTRAHRGVDYAAPSGTPIHAIGDGRIVFAGWKGGYGRFALIRHTNSNHTTAYGHMRAFARGIKKGKRVHQGQVIGYVGMTGLATGPHLHFEFRLRGRAVNPLTVKRAPAKPIASSELTRFQRQTAPLLSQLQELKFNPAWG
ncbi:MAG: peptidoglycan DD-metalloendopeptidase family protein [Mariprofundaceae bacterium]